MPSQTEQLGRDLLAHFLPQFRQIHNLRPAWLRNPKTGRRLEVDIYLPQIHTAVECDGIQHGRYIPGMQRDFEDFTDQQAKDDYKRGVCLSRGMRYYNLTVHRMQRHHFEPLIRQLMMELGLYEQFRRTPPPLHLYATADRLGSQRITTHNRRRYRKPGFINFLKRLFS